MQVLRFYTDEKGRRRPITVPHRSYKERKEFYGTPHPVDDIVKKMGYEHLEDLPKHKEKEFAERLVKEYGEKRARGMLIIQIIFRKNAPPNSKEHRFAQKLKRILRYI